MLVAEVLSDLLKGRHRMERAEEKDRNAVNTAENPRAEPVDEEDMEVDSQGDKLQNAVDKVTESGRPQKED
jgi:hypothetical protein